MRARSFVISLAASMLLIAGFVVRAEGRTYVVTHFIETQGLTINEQSVFDTTFFLNYSFGFGEGIADPGGLVTGEFYIIDQGLANGLSAPLKSATNIDVCNPCTFTLTPSNRKALGNVEGIANSVGGLPRPTVTGCIIFIVNGDVDNFDLSAFVVNSHTSAFDVSILPLQTLPLDQSVSPASQTKPFHQRIINYHATRTVVSNEPFSFYHDLNVLYAGGLPGTTAGTGATVNLRLYDDLTGQPLLSMTNQPVCNPCSVNLTNLNRKHSFSFDALIRSAGGFPRPDVRGFATVEVTGDTKNVSLQNIATNTHTGPNDVEFVARGRKEAVACADAGGQCVATSQSIFVLEFPGKVTNTPFTFDTNISMTYLGGLAGFPAGNGATVDLFLFNEATNQILKSATNQDVCNPCTTNLTPMNRKRTIVLDDEIVAKGGFPIPELRGYVMWAMSEGLVAGESEVVNSHTGPLDLAVFAQMGTGLPSALTSPFQSPSVSDLVKRESSDDAAPEALPRVLSSEYNFSHFRDRTGKASNTTFTFDSEFHAVYNGTTSATLELYLYDQLTSLPLMSLTNQPVCNPCNLPLNTTTKKRRIIVDDLITAAGGFPRTDVAGFAKIRVTGDASRVGILGMLINSHSGPNDLSTSELPARRMVRRTTDFDINGDGRADIGVFRPNDPLGSMFYFLLTGSNQFSTFRWGLPTDKIAPADYDGDGRSDIAIWRDAAFANFYIFNSSNSTVRVEQFGQTGDFVSVVGDWDGDGRDDLAVYRNGAMPGAQSFFFYRGTLNNPNGNVTYLPWGTNGDEAQRGDFDGDGKEDAAVFRPSNGIWYILNSMDNSVRYAQWGLATDHRVSGDFDGDGRTDLTVYRNGTWYILHSSNGDIRFVNWGLPTDTLVPADYDGDGRADIAVWRPSDGNWYILRSLSGNIEYKRFGMTGDRPLPCVMDVSSFATCP